MSTYSDCVNYLYEQLPMFQRQGSTAFKKDLNNTLALCSYLEQPQEHFRSVHVAGTNGKGSVCHMLAAVAQSAGYKVGLYTSPHYHDFRERIRVDGRSIPEDEVVAFVEKIKPVISTLSPSFFEITVAMAFDYFRNENVDLAIIETGLGGRLDSTNVVFPLLSVITNISFDHQQFLGETLALIAAEKAGIVKRGVPVLIGEKQSETEEVFRRKADEKEASLYYANDIVGVQSVSNQGALQKLHLEWRVDTDLPASIELALTGSYQEKNVSTVLAAIKLLTDLGHISINADNVLQGLAEVRSLTGIEGRWQILAEQPLVIADSAHNEVGVSYAVQQLEALQRPHRMVIGFVKDKSYRDILALLPKEAIYYWSAAQLPRALDSEVLGRVASEMGLSGQHYPSVAEALKQAISDAAAGDVVFIGGSTFVVAEALALQI